MRWTQSSGDATKFIDREAQFEKPSSTYLWDGLRVSRRHHGQLSLYYVIYTIILATNSWVQFLWLNSVIQSPADDLWGPSVIADLIVGKDWEDSGHFPRITHCDFYKRKTASVQTEAVLCVLNLNIYYEKLLLFLWFWMAFVAIVSTANCVSWSLTLCFKQRAQRKIRSYLMEHLHAPYLDKFFKTLGPDGLFILHQISLNVGDLPASYLSLAMLKTMNDHHSASDEYSQMLLEKGAKHV
uniref:Innexin n=1 Tax=Acrobeloides nanus TaxID=290746 RepID=A0A914DFI7_9BILA